MDLPDRACVACGRMFTPRSRRHQYDTATCRMRAQRARDAGAPLEATPAPSPHESRPARPSGLAVAVRTELEAAGVLDTFAGQLALELAGRLSRRDESGASSLSKELRTVMASALQGLAPPAGEDEQREEGDDLRKRRERKARQAARSA